MTANAGVERYHVDVGGFYLLRHRRMRWLTGRPFDSLSLTARKRAALMLHLIFAFTARVDYFLRRHAPTNLLLNAIRSRRGLKWGVPAMLLAVPYVYIARVLGSLIAHGAPGWLNLLVLIAAWNGLKFAVVGPVSVVLLMRVRTAEWRARRTAHGLAPSAA